MTLWYLGKAGGMEGLSHEAVWSKRFPSTATVRAKGREADICHVVREQQGALCKWSWVPVYRGGERRGDRRKGAIRDRGSGSEDRWWRTFSATLGPLAQSLSQEGATGEL